MKLTAFRIENFRSIHDSGWVDVDDIAVIVGKNESGKTSLLKALWKFKPFKDASYDLDREWPRGRRKEKSPDKIVATVRFEFSPEEIQLVEGIHESAKGVTGVEIQRNYAGTYFYNFLPMNPENGSNIEWVISLLKNRLGELPEGFSDHFKQQYTAGFNALLDEVRAKGGTPHAQAKLPDFKSRFPSYAHPSSPQHQSDHNKFPALHRVVDEAVEELKATPVRKAVDAIHERLPTFIYMDDYRIFRGSCQLNQVKQRKDNGNPTSDDATLIQIMEMAGLDLEGEVKKANAQDKEQRMLDLNDASLTLTEEIASRWSQKKYEVRFEADGQHFITFVKDVGVPALVPLEDRSKGFQWFFSFDMMFMYETRGEFKNAIILLDEPGLHLHAAAQRDLLERMRAYSKNNQLIYSTHLPFMIEFTRLDNLYVAEELPKEGTKVHKNWATADKDSRFTLQAALGLSWSQSLFVGQHNLIVEGVTDFWFITCLSTMLRDAGQEGLDAQLVVTPVGGASKAAYVGTILRGQKLNVAVLLDSDAEGKSAYEQLVKQWIMQAKHVLSVGDVLGVKESRTLEDLFDEAYYLAQTSAVYQKELAGQPLTLAAGDKRPIVERVEDALKAKGVASFNKGRVAKRIMEELPKKKLAHLSTGTVENFKKLIAAINICVADWKKNA
jgi:predicted ATP-dependent endonuclease of OLD family